MSEQAVTFGSGARLAGVLGVPGRRPGQEGASGSYHTARVDGVASLPAVILLNAGLLHHVGPHRMNVEIARRLADLGVPTLRFDLSGIGDSGPRRDRMPFRESLFVETREAMDLVEDRLGVDRFVLLGLCSGADQAFQVALNDTRVAGAVMIDGYPYPTPGFYVRRYGKPFLRKRTWKKALLGKYRIGERIRNRLSPGYEAPVDPGLAVRDIPPREESEAGFQRLLNRGAELLVIFTAGQLGTYNHAGQFREMYRRLRIGDKLQYEFFDAADHTCTRLAVRRLLVDSIVDWYARTWWE